MKSSGDLSPENVPLSRNPYRYPLVLFPMIFIPIGAGLLQTITAHTSTAKLSGYQVSNAFGIGACSWLINWFAGPYRSGVRICYSIANDILECDIVSEFVLVRDHLRSLISDSSHLTVMTGPRYSRRVSQAISNSVVGSLTSSQSSNGNRVLHSVARLSHRDRHCTSHSHKRPEQIHLPART
jgi:hypothetical protein